MPELIERGKVYIAQPPLYLIKAGKKHHYAYSDGERDEVTAELAKRNTAYEVQRYKGLAEMNPQQLWETTMNPEQRALLQVELDRSDGNVAEVDELFKTLMGDEVEPRRQFIQKYPKEVRNLDIQGRPHVLPIDRGVIWQRPKRTSSSNRSEKRCGHR